MLSLSKHEERALPSRPGKLTLRRAQGEERRA